MLSFISFLIATIFFFLIGHKDITAADEIWGFFFVGLGLTLAYLPQVITNGYNRFRRIP